MKELLIIGFAEKHRALEVLPQLQRLHFGWSQDLQNAVAVEVERDGGLKLFHGLLLDSVAGIGDAAQWRSILSAIHPPPYWAYHAAPGLANTAQTMEPLVNERPAQPSLNGEFIRDAAALLQPGRSVLLAIIHDREAVLPVVSGYSRFVLHTRLDWPGNT